MIGLIRYHPRLRLSFLRRHSPDGPPYGRRNVIYQSFCFSTRISELSSGQASSSNFPAPKSQPYMASHSAKTIEPLWTPSSPQNTATHRLISRINHQHNLSLRSYEDLWRWSTDNVSSFWNEVWTETNVLGQNPSGANVAPGATPASNPEWFPGAKINWAENMLKRRDNKIALIQATEPTTSSPNPPYRKISYKELHQLVSKLVSSLLECGIRPGDRVASYASNCIENVAAALAVSAIGGIWVSVSADFGPDAALSRFQQVQPRVVFSVDEVVYNGKVHQHLPKLATLLSSLDEQQTKVVVVSSFGANGRTKPEWKSTWNTWDEFVQLGQQGKKGLTQTGEIDWWRGPFDWPLWILFSSGTTSKPKPIVHRAGGMLLQSKKEFEICADMTENDVFFYYTTTGWMMWNFLVNALSVGCTLVLYDGSPLRTSSLLWKMAEDLKFTIFGTSAKYIDQLSKSYKPREHHDLSALRHIYSTGSPLAAHLFDYVYEDIHPKVMLSSITGGTDICSLFAGMSTAVPVYRGELQCKMLGMAIDSYSSEGKPAPPGESGELVCTKPFPCQPLGFWPLPGFGDAEEVKAAQERYRQSYFDTFKDVWYHGDHVLITPSRQGNGGGVIVLGRSDGVLNPGGIRFGSSEIYDVMDACFTPSTSGIVDSLVVGQATHDGTDERVVLFVQLSDGVLLTNELQDKIRREIRTRRTARHVPEKIIQVKGEIPYTLNGKKVEVPVKKILNGTPVEKINLTTLRNPECLREFVQIGEGLRKESSGLNPRL